MRNKKANIGLWSAAQLPQCGWRLALRKGMSELLCRRRKKSERQPLPSERFSLPVSIILCTIGTCPVLKDAISAAVRQTMKKELYEVIVVWNRDDDPPAEAYPKEIRWVREPRRGLSRARNAGAAAARGRVLLYIDDDAVAESNTAAAIWQSFEKRSRAVIVGGQIRLCLPRPKAVAEGQEALWSGYTVSYRRYRAVKEAFAFPYGACFAIRHGALCAMGGFSEEYGRVGENYAGGEETALCYRALSYGWEVGICPQACVEHRVEERRFTEEHAKKTLKEGIYTTYRLCCDGYTPFMWDAAYLRRRMEIIRQELKGIERDSLAYRYKRWEYEAFEEICSAEIRKEGNRLCKEDEEDCGQVGSTRVPWRD